MTVFCMMTIGLIVSFLICNQTVYGKIPTSSPSNVPLLVWKDCHLTHIAVPEINMSLLKIGSRLVQPFLCDKHTDTLTDTQPC